MCDCISKIPNADKFIFVGYNCKSFWGIEAPKITYWWYINLDYIENRNFQYVKIEIDEKQTMNFCSTKMSNMHIFSINILENDVTLGKKIVKN